MAFREKSRRNVQPLLDPGEEIQAIFGAQTGPIFFSIRFVLIVATDRRIVVVRSSLWRPTSANGVLATFARVTRLGPVSGLSWGRIELGGVGYWVNRRFHKDVRAADAAGPLGPLAG